MPGVTITSGSSSPSGTMSSHLGDGGLGGHRHDRAEVARGLAVHQVAPAVAAQRLDQREVGVDGRLQHVVAAVDQARFLALGQQGAVAGRAEEAADAGAGGADAFGQVALGREFELDLAGAVQRVEVVGIGLAREGADDLAHPLGLQQRRQAGFAVAGVVVDDGELARALGDQRVDQRGRHAGVAEAADHHGGAVVHVGDGALERFEMFYQSCLVGRQPAAHLKSFVVFDNRTNDRLTFQFSVSAR
jgi:hypothetical protein